MRWDSGFCSVYIIYDVYDGGNLISINQRRRPWSVVIIVGRRLILGIRCCTICALSWSRRRSVVVDRRSLAIHCILSDLSVKFKTRHL